MTVFKIHKWANIQKEFTNKLLLGNGASRAVWDKFKYPSLYKEAQKAGRLDADLVQLFDDFVTGDFEYILRLLSQTNKVNEILDIKDKKTLFLYQDLQEALIGTIRSIHPEAEQVKSLLLPMAEFMKRFDTILNLNYDLLVYWAMLEANNHFGQWFKDGFIDEGRFNNSYQYLKEPYDDADGFTLVFYPHGSLILATDSHGGEIKLSKTCDQYLLNTILGIWKERNNIPLFISEGATGKKLEAIRRSNYLKTVYDCEVEGNCKSLVVYGWSFGDQDEHILKGIIKGGVERIAVSVHESTNNEQDYCEYVERKVRMMEKSLNKKTESKIYFYDSDSDGVWINKLEEVIL